MVHTFKDLLRKTSRSSTPLSPDYIWISRGNVLFPEILHQLHSLFMLTSHIQRHFSLVWHGLNLPLLGVVHDRKVGGFSAVTQCRVLWQTTLKLWSTEEVASILKVLRGEVKAGKENSDLPLSPRCLSLLFTNLKSYSLDFPWDTLRFSGPSLELESFLGYKTTRVTTQPAGCRSSGLSKWGVQEKSVV